MAYGRVNILGQSGTKNYKGLDSVGGSIDGYIEYIDFSRQRKVINDLGKNKSRILDFNNNIIGEYEGTGMSLQPSGLLEFTRSEGYYDIKTGKRSDLPKIYRDGYYINLEGDHMYYDKPYIYNKDGSVRFNLKFEYGKNIKYYVTGDAYYFYNIDREGFILYKYKDRKLNTIKEFILPKDIVGNLRLGIQNSLEFMDGNIIYLD